MVISLLLLLLVFGMAVASQNRVPPLWFDEGWSLSLARNWVQYGHYGHLLLGKPVPATILNTGFPAIGPIALAFRVFGVGSWQARVSGVVFTFLTFCALYRLSRRFYGHRSAGFALLVALFLPVYPDLHPILVGRQALGEMPSVFYLLMGYICFLWAWRRPWYVLALPALLWGLSLRTKPQILPFLVASMCLSIVQQALFGKPRLATRLFWTLAMTLVFDRALAWVWNVYAREHSLAAMASSDPYAVLGDIRNILLYVVVPDLRVRWATLCGTLLLSGWPAGVAVVWFGLRLPRIRAGLLEGNEVDILKSIVWAFVGLWYLWYLLLSIGWQRYLFPATIVGVPLIAGFLNDVTNGFRFRAMLLNGARVLRRSHRSAAAVGTTALLLTVLISVYLTLGMLAHEYSASDSSLEGVVKFLNERVHAGEVVETYSSELYFLTDVAYHYPPDEIQHMLNRKMFLDEQVPLAYDPLLADPEYLVEGPMDRMWGLYEPILGSEQFELAYTNASYRVYRRVR